MRKGFFWAVIVAAFLSRFLYLDYKPIHFDESINGWFLLKMNHMGFYQYDPQNYHGPLHFYLLQVWTALFGETLISMRALTTLFSFATVLFFLKRSFWTAFFILVSPSLIFYGRSAIHESAFVFSQVLFFVGMYEYQKKRRLTSLWWALLGFLGMASQKETFVFTGLATLVAIIMTYPWKSFVRDMWGSMRLPIAYVIGVLAVLFSGFGADMGGILNFFRSFTYWSATSGASGHNKSFWYWIELAYAAEPLLLFAGVIAVFCLFVKKYRILSVFALAGWLLYSIVPYKTPWCLASFAWPFYYLLGEVVGDSRVWSWRTKIPMYFVIALLVGIGARSAWTSVYQYPIDLEHPFVYVNSTYEFKRLDDFLQKTLRERPELRNEFIQLSLDETWPMTWTLHNSRGLRHDRFNDKIYPSALIYFCEQGEGLLLGKEAEKYHSKVMVIRKYGRPVLIYLRKDIFKEFPK